MQDKEFDQLFKDRFEDAEIQPSARVWGSIAEELEPKKKRGSLLLYWMSAAAIAAVVLSIGLLSPKTETIRLQSQVAVTADPAADVKDPATVKNTSAGDVVDVAPEGSTPLVIAPRLSAADIKNSLAVVQPKESVEHPVHKEAATSLAVANEPIKQVEPANEVMIASADLPVEDAVNSMTEAPQAAHRGIRNVGDLVNFVVGKVDRRENKIVQFDTDDDNSSLVSLNLGIIRFSKKSSK